MKCKGCYKEVKTSYCLNCRKKLFDKAKVTDVLSFDSPKADNIIAFQEHSKKLSISGVQLKYSLRLENNALILTEKGAQFILKPVPPSNQLLAIAEVPENEHLTMQIAEQIFNINTAANALIYFKDGNPAYITKRFDVRADGTKYQQEDFAQLTNRTKATHGDTFKYDGTYEEIGKLIAKYASAAIPALEQFFKVVVFNYVFSNGDAHLKNFSLLRNDENEYRLSPAYDLLSSIVHTPHESDTAIDLYADSMRSKFYTTYGYYGRPDFLALSQRLGIVEKRALRTLDSFPTAYDSVEQMVKGSFLTEGTQEVYLKNLKDKLLRIQQME